MLPKIHKKKILLKNQVNISRLYIRAMALKKTGLTILKIVVLVCAWIYIVKKISNVYSADTIILRDAHIYSVGVLCAVGLMFLNWGIESLKWKFLLRRIQVVPYSTAIKAVCIAMPLSLITPNRVGEIGGRSLAVSQHKKKTMLASLLGSMLQLSVTLFFGILGFIGYLCVSPSYSLISRAGFISLGILIVLSIVSILVLHYGRLFKRLFFRILGGKRYVIFLKLYRTYTLRDLCIGFALSALRYIIFSTQFAILVHVFIPDISILSVYISIFLVYFFSTVIPSPVLGEIGIRGSVAMIIFGLLTSSNELLIFQISMLVWIINMIPPTLAGSILLLAQKKATKKVASD